MSSNDNLSRAFSEINAERYDEFFKPGPKHRFSLAYTINRRRLIRKTNSNSFASYRPMSIRQMRFVLIAVILSLIALTGFCTYRVVNGFGLHIYYTHSAVNFDNIENPAVDFSRIYGIEGLEPLNTEKLHSTIKSEYSVDDKTFYFSQFLTEVNYCVDTENKTVEPININENNGFYIEDGVDLILLWENDGYIFTIIGNIDKNTAINLAESTKILK